MWYARAFRSEKTSVQIGDLGQSYILAALNHLTNLYYLICHLKIIWTFTLEQPP